MSEYIQTFVLAGLTVTGIQYLGNAVDPKLGGILSGVPISIPAMLLIKNLGKKKEFIETASIMVTILAGITILCWYLLTKLKWTSHSSVEISIVIWVIISLLYYFLYIKK